MESICNHTDNLYTISSVSDWTFAHLKKFDHEISNIANSYKLDTYPNQIEIITAHQMMDAYSSIGMPISYNHWSFGKQFTTIEKTYKRGFMGLAYELVINSNPCISYLLEENTLAMQALVIAHACYGHNSFFKGNYLFKTMTNAESIIDYFVMAKKYIAECEEKYGITTVEQLLDAAHSLMNYGVDKYKRPHPKSSKYNELYQIQKEEYLQSQVNELWKTLPKSNVTPNQSSTNKFLKEPEENILYFLENYAPNLKSWERKIIQIVRNIAQYFYPQKQTKVMNEGWATFWHYQILNTMFEKRLISDKFMMETIHNHTNVISQLEFDHKCYSGINPYCLGFSMFQDIKRICCAPTEEDKKWFPDICGSNWLETFDFIMKNFKDDSFIAQFLSPKVIRDLKLFAVLDDFNKKDIEVIDIHNDEGYKNIRHLLSVQYNLSIVEPSIHVHDYKHNTDRSLILRYIKQTKRPLNINEADDVMKYLHQLWKFDTYLEEVDEQDSKTIISQYPKPKTNPKLN